MNGEKKMRCNNQAILDKVYRGEITNREINELFRYLIGRDLWKQYLKYEKGGEKNG